MSLKYELEQWVAALEAYDLQDFEKALDHLNGIADSSKILFNIGLIHATLGEHEDAVNFFIKAVELDQYLSVAYFQCGVSNFLLGDFESALQNFSDALLYLRGNTIIDYEQLGLKFRLYSCEVLFNRGLCYLYMGNDSAGMADMEYAAKEKQTDEHSVIDEAVQDRGEGYTVFSIPVGVVYRPNEQKVKNAKSKNYLGEARLVAASDARDAFTGFTGAKVLGDEIARSTAMTPQTTNVIPRAAPPGSGGNRPVSVSINPKNSGGAFPRRSVRGRPPSQILKAVAEVPPPMPFDDGYGEDDLLEAYSRGDEDEMQGSGIPRRMQANRNKSQQRSNSRQGSQSRGKNGSPVRRAKSVASSMTRSTSSGRMRSKYYDDDDFDDDDRRSYGSYSDEYDDDDDEVDDRKSRYVGGKGAKPAPSVRRLKEESPGPQRRGTQRGTMSASKRPPHSRSNSRNGSISRRNTSNSRSLSREASKRGNRNDRDEEGYISGGYSDYDDPYEEEDDAEFEMVTSRKVAEITKVKVKVHSEDTRVIMVDFKMTYEKLLDKIQDKLSLREEPRIQFRDEDGGMVTMTDQDDLDMALLHAQREARKEAWETGRMEVWCV